MSVYAVAVGRNPGIYYNWDACKAEIYQFSGAKYKRFDALWEAEEYIQKFNQPVENIPPSEVVAYVDGSYDDFTKCYSYGAVLIIGDAQIELSEKFDNSDYEMAKMRNVAGEITGARKAMEYCVEHGYKSLDIYHDYEGIGAWCTGSWEARKPRTMEYRDYYNSIKDEVKIRFFKVKGHSGDHYNEVADSLAKAVLFDNQ